MSLQDVIGGRFASGGSGERKFGPLLIGAGVLVAIGVVGFIAWAVLRGPANNDNFPDGLQFICTNKDSPHPFQMSVRAVSDHHKAHYGQPIPCPKCNTPAVRAEKCPSCGEVFPVLQNTNKCPKCGKPLMPPASVS